MDIQDALNIAKIYALGTSQGGFIVSRMAILRPDKILGIVPIGSSMFAETEDTRKLGCWNALEIFPPVRFLPTIACFCLGLFDSSGTKPWLLQSPPPISRSQHFSLMI